MNDRFDQFTNRTDFQRSQVIQTHTEKDVVQTLILLQLEIQKAFHQLDNVQSYSKNPIIENELFYSSQDLLKLYSSLENTINIVTIHFWTFFKMLPKVVIVTNLFFSFINNCVISCAFG